MNVKYFLLVASMLLATVGSVMAQSNPNWTLGFVPSPAQWNAEWGTKVDTSGGTLTGGTITGGTISGTIAGTPTFSGSVSLTSPTISGGAMSGTITGSPTFSGSPVVSSATVVSPQGSSHTLSGWMAGYNVIYPTNTSADETTLQNALNGSQPVLMAPGTWRICSQMTMPANQHLEGIFTYANPGSFAPNQTFSKTVIQCPSGSSSFSAGQAFVAMKDHDVVRGIDFYCPSDLSANYNGINALNAVSVEMDHNSIFFCKEGISRFSDGSVPGFSAAYSQLAHIHDNLFYEETDHGYYATFTNGGFVSDEIIGPNNDFVAIDNASAVYLGGFVVSVNVFGNRLEDAPLGIELTNGDAKITIIGNTCDQIGCVKINGTGNPGINTVSVVGNYGSLNNSFGAITDVELAGTISNLQIAGNTWAANVSPIYTVDTGTLLSSATLNELPSTTTSVLYKDAFTQSVLQPITGINNGTLSGALPPITLTSPNPGGHISFRGFAPAVSSCGTGSPSVAGDDASGTITTGTGSPTACTLTFAAAYTVAPNCVPSTNSTSSVPDVSAISTSAVTFSLSATATKIYYQCSEQVPNIFTGGIALASGWTAGQATLTTNATTDPLGGSTAAKLTEDNTNNFHYITQSITGSNTTYTMSAYVHTGSGGSARQVAFSVHDSGGGNAVLGFFDPATGNFNGSQLTGSGVISSTGSQAVGNGFYRVWMTFNLTAAPTSESYLLAGSNNDFYTGDGVSNIFIWGPAMRAGTLP